MNLTCRKNASYTIEAAVILPIYATFMVALLLFFRIFTVLWTVEVALHRVAEEAAYSGQEVDVHALEVAVLADITAHGGIFYYIDGGVLGMDFQDSEISPKDVTLSVDYQVHVPVGLLGPLRFSVQQEVVHRRWVGFDPREAGIGNDAYVYITKYGEDYHSRITCPYLRPSVRSVAREHVKTERNRDGHRYQACRYCHPAKKETVYVTDYGTTYHGSRTCSALRRSISKVPMSEVDGLRPCPKCYGGKD